ncbi:DNA-binding protein [Nocardia farcinica]|uniref:DNA-binding protein n=1 Tax=Nocardia farcinica TaxID=37329 RepID=UPI002453FB71|nr:DNA-binding protein [Nocardia farcinica]
MNDSSDSPPDVEHAPTTYEPTYPVSDGARAVRKSERWYLQQLRSGRFPGHKAGRTWYLTAADITAAIEETRRPSTGPRKPSQSTNQARPTSARPTRRRRPIPRQNP